MEPKDLKIFASQDVPRLRYIAGIILGDILGLRWEIATDRRKLGKYPVINYSASEIKGSFRISPDPLLFETVVKPRDITVSEWKNLPVFFQTTPDSDLPFDIFAASFYMVSRYEEYLDHPADEHGRFRASSSLAGKNGFIHRPVVDLWTREFARILLKKLPALVFRRNEFRGTLTIDIDEPFAYLGKSLLRSFGGLLHDLTSGEGRAGERYKVVKRERSDPFAVYDYLFKQIDTVKTEAKFFLPLGDRSRYDHNPVWKNNEYRALIMKITGKYHSGLHPSYYASTGGEKLSEESLRYRTITGRDPDISRFHYIRLLFPSSYSALAESGIKEDYSMGFHDEPGFRAGIARPFTFYDVSREKQTDLRIVPFQVMDATLIKYKNMDAASAKEVIVRIIDETRKAGGLFVSIWHNTTLLDTDDCKPWRELFELTLKYQTT